MSNQPVIAACILLTAVTAAQAQPPSAAGARAPVLAMPMPVGLQRGTEQEVVLTGTNLAAPTRIWSSPALNVTIPDDGDNGTNNERLRLNIAVPKDAPLGFYGLRL